jgi:pyruvate dehydrogenase (quinone)
MSELAMCAGSCGPGSLRSSMACSNCTAIGTPVVLIASQVVTDEFGFDLPQEVDFKAIYASCNVFCEEIRSPAQARRKTAMAALAALAHRGIAVLIVPADLACASAPKEPDFAMHRVNPAENGGAKLDHGSGGEVLLRAA